MSIFRSEFREVEIDYFDQKYKLYIGSGYLKFGRFFKSLEPSLKVVS